MSMKISEQGIALIKSFESCKLTAYKALNTEKYYTIGWGHYGADVKAGQSISQEEADALFLTDLQKFVKYTNSYTKMLTLNQNQFDSLVSFCYNCGPGKLKKLVSGRTVKEIAEHITDEQYTRSTGKVIKWLVQRRQKEKELFCESEGSEVKSMSIKIGSARIDENGKLTGGAVGDQTGNEVSIQPYYAHSKGWYLLRPKDVSNANTIADAMQAACDNNNIGYCQGHRTTVITMLQKYGSMAAIKEKTEADCSSLVRGCCIEAGFDPGNFNTANEATCLEKTGRFESKVAVTATTVLYNGDILVTKTKGHTVIVVSGNPRTVSSAQVVQPQKNSSNSNKKLAPDKAKSFDKSISGKYRVKSSLNLRLGASKLKTSIAIMAGGDTVQCFGYYTLADGKKWYLVQYKELTGFCSSGYLIKE